MSGHKNILVIEDQTLVRDLLADVCRSVLPTAEIMTAHDGASGRVAYRARRPDLVLLDLGLPDADGLELLSELLRPGTGLKVIVFSGYIDEFTIHCAVRLNVHGMIDKNEQPLAALKEAVLQVLAGETYFSPAARRIQARLRADPVAFNKLLSDREQEMLGLFGRGMGNEEVANLYHLSVHTVKIHRRNIMGKLNLHSTPHLIRYALDKGFVRAGRMLAPSDLGLSSASA